MASKPSYVLGNSPFSSAASFPTPEELEKERLSIDWATWEPNVKLPQFYDPPQLKMNWWGCGLLNWTCFSSRSSCLSWPCVPCCCHCALKCCIKSTFGAEEFRITDPDDALIKMLTSRVSPHCPEFLKGVYWMRDNIAQEVLITLSDAEWTPEGDFGIKYARYNWTTNNTSFGGTWLAGKIHYHKLSVSPNKKWVQLGSMANWIYVVQPEDHFKLKDGTPVDFTAGDELMRIDWGDGIADGTGELQYQYRWQRIAYLDKDGKLVKTKFYDELKRRATMPDSSVSCCCGYLARVKEDKDVEKLFEPLGNCQAVVYAPPQSTMAEGPAI